MKRSIPLTVLHLPLPPAGQVQSTPPLPPPPTSYLPTIGSTNLIPIDPQLSHDELGYFPYNHR